MTMLQNQLAKGNNGLIKTKYLTFGIDADSIKAAKPRLERIETDILNNFKRLGVVAEMLDGKARLAQLGTAYFTWMSSFRSGLSGIGWLHLDCLPRILSHPALLNFALADSSVWVKNTGLFLLCRFLPRNSMTVCWQIFWIWKAL